MSALATLEDLAARTSIAIDDVDRATAVLDDASAAVRVYTGRPFEPSATTTERCRVRNGVARPTGSPITAVSAVADVNGNAVTFTWEMGDRVEVSMSVPDTFSFEPRRTPLRTVDITYTHGAAVPDVVVAVVCQMAARALGAPPESSGIQTETLGPYSLTVGAAAASGGVGMLQGERDLLAAFRRGASMAVLS